MADFTVTTKTDTRTYRVFPTYSKTLTLTAGQKLTDIADLVAFAQKTVPANKVATVKVSIAVTDLRSA